MLFGGLRFTIPAPGGLCITCASQEKHRLPPNSPIPPHHPQLSPFRLAIGSVLCEFQLHYVIDTDRADGLDQLLVSCPLRGRGERPVSAHAALRRAPVPPQLTQAQPSGGAGAAHLSTDTLRAPTENLKSASSLKQAWARLPGQDRAFLGLSPYLSTGGDSPTQPPRRQSPVGAAAGAREALQSSQTGSEAPQGHESLFPEDRKVKLSSRPSLGHWVSVD